VKKFGDPFPFFLPPSHFALSFGQFASRLGVSACFRFLGGPSSSHHQSHSLHV